MTVALVTGAAKRLGREIALELARNGWDIAIHYRASKPDACSLESEIHSLGRRACLVDADLSVETQVQTIFPRACAELGELHLLVNCASLFEDDRISNVTRASWDRHLETNLRAPLVLSQAFAAQLPKGEGGSIINIIDQTVLNLTPQFLSYTVSKAALWTLTQTLAQALAPMIRVNAVAPGPSLKASHQSQQNFDRHVQSTLLKRPSLPKDIAGAVMYLASAQSVTGQMIAVDSGQHLGWSQSDLIE